MKVTGILFLYIFYYTGRAFKKNNDNGIVISDNNVVTANNSDAYVLFLSYFTANIMHIVAVGDAVAIVNTPIKIPSPKNGLKIQINTSGSIISFNRHTR